MCSWLRRTVSFCMHPFSRYTHVNKDDVGGEDDPLLSYRDLEKHSHGEFSWAVVQANEVLEDQSQIETGRYATFVGVYDGHGGDEAAKYISEHLFHFLLGLARETGRVSESVLRKAFIEIEKGFLALVRSSYSKRPAIAAVGSCCLVGVIWEKTLYIANLGDSRAVIGHLDSLDKIAAEQLTRDHNASMEVIRKELKALHPDDPQIVVMKHGVWRIKGLIQVSRSIGDAYLKTPEFSLNRSFPRFHLDEPVRYPVLRSDPSMLTRDLEPSDKFLIFASDGLWEHLTNQEAVEMVQNNPRTGIARRLLISAMEKAAETRKLSYSEIKTLYPGERRLVHDDITVTVIFIDHKILDNNDSAPDLSIQVQGYADDIGSSRFEFGH